MCTFLCGSTCVLHFELVKMDERSRTSDSLLFKVCICQYQSSTADQPGHLSHQIPRSCLCLHAVDLCVLCLFVLWLADGGKYDNRHCVQSEPVRGWIEWWMLTHRLYGANAFDPYDVPTLASQCELDSVYTVYICPLPLLLAFWLTHTKSVYPTLSAVPVHSLHTTASHPQCHKFSIL